MTHDFLHVDDLLTDEDRAIRDTVRDFAQSELAPHVAEWYDEGTLPDDLGPLFGKLGLLGMHLEGYGCAGTSATAYGVACRELEAVDSGLRSFVSVQGSLAMFAIHRWGSDEHKEEWLPRMATGEAIGCFGLTESDAGSDPGSMKTRAPQGRRRLGAQRLQDVDHQRHARRRRGRLGADRRGHPRVRRPDRHARASRPTRSSASSRCGRRSPPSSPSTTCGCRPTRRSPRCAGSRVRCRASTRRATASSGASVGAARACLRGVAGLHDASASSSASRWRRSSSPSASSALMTVAVNNASLVAWRLGALKDAGTLTPTQVSYGKYANVRAALDVAREARTTLGGAGITLDHSVMRHMNNLETVMTYEGTEEMHLLSVGAELTGIPAFR